MTAPDLALVGVVRLRQALEKYTMAGGDPKRVAQLQAIRQHSSARSAAAAAMPTPARVESGEALRAVVARFAAAEGAIGEDIPALLGGEPAAPGSDDPDARLWHGGDGVMSDDEKSRPSASDPMPRDGAQALAWAIVRAGREIAAAAIDRMAEATQRLANSQF